jgi:hypothetical protein
METAAKHGRHWTGEAANDNAGVIGEPLPRTAAIELRDTNPLISGTVSLENGY